MSNLRASPTNPKFGDLNHAKITKKLSSCIPALSLLFAAGFARSADGERLKWKDTQSNRKRLADIYGALQAKEDQQDNNKTNGNKDEAREEQIAELMENGFSRQEAEDAIQMSVTVDAVCRCTCVCNAEYTYVDIDRSIFRASRKKK